jgi:Immunoglobulin domain
MHHISFKAIGPVAAFIVFAWLAATADAAISVGPSGAGPLTFDTPPEGTDFLSAYFGGSGTSFTTTSQEDSAVASVAASAFDPSFTLDTSATIPPSTFAYGFRYNSTGHYLQSRATTQSGATNNPTAAAIVLLATLQNDTGADQGELIVSYDMGVSNQITGELPGYRVYYNLTGAAGNWQVIPEFSGIETQGTVTATLTFSSPWPSGTAMYLFWFDDNANGVTDPGYTIDNFAVTLGSARPVQILNASSLTNRTVVQCQSVSLAVSASGSPAPTYQWFHDNNPIASATSATLSIPSMTAADAGRYYVQICNSFGCTNSPTNRLTYAADTNALTMLVAIGSNNLTTISVLFSRPIDTNFPFAEDFPFNASIFPAGDTNSPLGILSATVASDTEIVLETDPRDPATKYRLRVREGVTAVCPAALSIAQDSEIPIASFEVSTIALDEATLWRYDDSGTDRGTAWREANYDDSAWAQGAGLFDAKSLGCRPMVAGIATPVRTCIRMANAAGEQIPTVYFRKKFNYTPQSGQLFRFYIDDGAAVYLNGEEVFRVGLPSGPLTYASLADRQFDVPVLEQLGYVYLGDFLHAGENVIAVEVHQAALTSSDITMGLELLSVVPEPPASAVQLAIELISGQVHVSWNPVIGTLQATDNLKADPAATVWSDVATSSPYVAPANQAFRFYRVLVRP